MVKLFFENSYEESIFIIDCLESEVLSHISNFVYNKNPNFKIYYTRIWKDSDKTWYDVGSHSEFFYTIPKE